jgi:hypothetical protein
MSEAQNVVAEAELRAQEQAKIAAAADASKDGAKVLLSTGEARISYIRKRWKEGVSRGQITKEVNALRIPGTKEVQYQIIFSATKDVPGGPPKAVEVPAATTATAAE